MAGAGRLLLLFGLRHGLGDMEDGPEEEPKKDSELPMTETSEQEVAWKSLGFFGGG